MSSTLDHPVDSGDLLDRRRPSAGPRLSWASPRPFLPPVGHGAAARREAEPVTTPGRREWQGRLVASQLAGDAVLALLVLLGVGLSTNDGVAHSALVALLGAAAWVAALAALRAYDVRRTGSGPEELQAVMRAAGGVGTLLALVSYAGRFELARRYVLLAVPAVAVGTLVVRYAHRRALHRRRQLRQDGFRTLVVGPQRAVIAAIAALADEPHHGYQVVGACLPAYAPEAGLPTALLGAMADVPQVVVDRELDVVLVVGDELSGEPLRRLSWALERTDADLVVAPGLVEVGAPRVAVRPTAGLSLLHLEPPSRRVARRLGKDVIDRCLGALLLVVALPVVTVAGLAVTLTSPGGVFYRQVRIGRDGRPFRMYKLRTMVADAARLRDTLLADSDRDGPMFKMHRDPRVTPVGRVLRRFSLDELPQLINVVRGDMSLVGPRPPLPEEVDAYLDFVNRRLHVRPGLTGLWQVSGRADLDWEQSVNLDLRYVDNWSLALDLQILWKTARAVLHGSGAY
jgi:exopolysaccharide biosynthesis polyprenyl glycosylphosphotransferase